jgi:SPP1 family predicted phage head-tail adaptor
MNKIIDIQEAAITYNSYNEPIEEWKNVTGLTGLYASVITTGGREFYAAQKLNAEVTAVFKLRYIEGITNLMRVKYGGRYFQIFFVNNVDEKNEYLLLSCKEVV